MADIHITATATAPIQTSEDGQVIYGDGLESASLMRSYIDIRHDNVVVRDLPMRYDSSTEQNAAISIYGCTGVQLLRLDVDVNRGQKQAIIVSGASVADRSTNILISDCIIHGVGSSTDYTTAGAYLTHGLYTAYCEGVMVNGCLFYENWSGWAVHNWTNVDPYPRGVTLYRCMFVDNKSAVYMANDQQDILSDKCIMAYNGVGAVFTFAQMKTGWYLFSPDVLAEFVVTDSIVFGNDTTDYYKDGGVAGTWTPAVASVDPTFIDRANNDYRFTNPAAAGYGPSWLDAISGGTPAGPLTIVDSVASSGVDASNAVSITLPAAIEPSDLLILCAYSDSNAVGDTPAGWTLLQTPVTGGTDGAGRVWYRVADGSEDGSVVTVTGSYDQPVAVCLQLRGQKSGTPISASAFQANAASVSCTAPAITPADDDCLLVGFFCSRTGVASATPPGTMTEQEDVAPNSAFSGAIELATQQLAGGGGSSTGTRIATLSASRANCGVLVAVAPAVAAAGTLHRRGMMGILP